MEQWDPDQKPADNKTQAARVAAGVAAAFNRAAAPDPQAAEALRRSLPVAAVKLFQAGRDVTPSVWIAGVPDPNHHRKMQP